MPSKLFLQGQPHRQEGQRQEQPVRTASVRVQRCLRRLRRDPVPQVHHPALRRADDGGQRHGLLLHLRRFGFVKVEEVVIIPTL